MPCNFITMAKTYQQINERIKNGEAVVLTAEEVSQLALTMSPEEIARPSAWNASNSTVWA